MRSRSIGGFFPYRRRYAGQFFCVLCLLPALGLGQSTKVYRCERADGRIEFRQGPCLRGEQDELLINDVRTGWDAPVSKVKRETRKAKRNKTKTSKKAVSDKTCFSKRQRLEAVNRKLRRGYKAGQGVKLRDRRREYEAFLSRFCD